MKKIIATIPLMLALVMLLLCSCTGKDGTEDLKAALNYPVAFSAEVGELAFELTLSSKSEASAKMSAPRTLSGLDLVKSGDDVNASYKGMTVPLPEASASKVFMLADIINAVITALDENTYTVESGSEYNTVSALCGDAVCKLTYTPDGTVSSAEISCGGKRTVYNLKQISSDGESESTSSTASSDGGTNQSKDASSNAEKSG